MAIKPILFNTAMVRAIREDEKTQTRRVIPPEEVAAVLTSPCRLGNPDIPDSRFVEILCSTKYEKGDVLWVRENWAVAADLPGIAEGGFVYMADYSTYELEQLRRKHFRWRPSIHMPKVTAREFLLVTDVRQSLCSALTLPASARKESGVVVLKMIRRGAVPSGGFGTAHVVRISYLPAAGRRIPG